MENNYVTSFPNIMEGKKILYVHGFASSGLSGTAVKIRQLLPGAEVIAPDLPIHPAEAIELLRYTCNEIKPDLIIGTSMGGMYTEMLYGYDRILVNPAFQIGDTILKNNMLGKVTFLNPRKDGIKEFMMTKQLQEEYREMTENCFSAVSYEERTQRVFGLFGIEDPLVHTFELFASHYNNAIQFHGEHRLNDSILLHSVMPVIQWIDDRQNGRERNIIYISVEDTLRKGNTLLPSALKGYRYLLEYYNIYLVADAPTNSPQYAADMQSWVKDNIGVPAYNRLILTNQKNLLYGDYLIDAHEDNGATEFMSTRLHFGDETFKTWDDVIEYFSHLGGQ